jgi:hypothetical protein
MDDGGGFISKDCIKIGLILGLRTRFGGAGDSTGVLMAVYPMLWFTDRTLISDSSWAWAAARQRM